MAKVTAYVNWANQIYAQIGIRFDFSIQIVDPPPGVDLSTGLLNGKTITNQARLLLGYQDYRHPGDHAIEVYYVNQLIGSNGVPNAVGTSFASR